MKKKWLLYIHCFEVCVSVQSKSKFNYFYVNFAPITQQTIINDDDDCEWKCAHAHSMDGIHWMRNVTAIAKIAQALCTKTNEYLLCFETASSTFCLFIFLLPPLGFNLDTALEHWPFRKTVEFVVLAMMSRNSEHGLRNGRRNPENTQLF